MGGRGWLPLRPAFRVLSVPFNVAPGQEYIFQKSAFLASEATVNLSVHFQKRLGSGFFGGEGFILQRVSGYGTVFAEFDGHVVEYELAAGHRIVIDTGHPGGYERQLSDGYSECAWG